MERGRTYSRAKSSTNKEWANLVNKRTPYVFQVRSDTDEEVNLTDDSRDSDWSFSRANFPFEMPISKDKGTRKSERIRKMGQNIFKDITNENVPRFIEDSSHQLLVEKERKVSKSFEDSIRVDTSGCAMKISSDDFMKASHQRHISSAGNTSVTSEINFREIHALDKPITSSRKENRVVCSTPQSRKNFLNFCDVQILNDRLRELSMVSPFRSTNDLDCSEETTTIQPITSTTKKIKVLGTTCSSQQVTLAVQEEVQTSLDACIDIVSLSLSPEKKLVKLCDQKEFMLFTEIYDWKNLKKCQKIGEGSFGDVYILEFFNNCSIVIKIIPIEIEEQQKKMEDMLSELIISKCLNNLQLSSVNRTSNFIKLLDAKCVRGRMPMPLVTAWIDFKGACYSKHPKQYPRRQLYLILETEYGGVPIDDFEFHNASEAQAAFNQIICALAIAEEELSFEHRDLHLGNILLSRTKTEEVHYIYKGKHFILPSYGVFARIIDFTLSRISSAKGVIFGDLNRCSYLFEAYGELHFEVYRCIQKHSKGDWQNFIPYSNILWLHYVIVSFLEGNLKATLSEDEAARKFFYILEKVILQCESAGHLLCNLKFWDY